MRHRLIFKTGMETAENEIHEKGGPQHGEQAQKEMHLTEKDEIPERAHGTETAALRDKTYDQRKPERNEQRSVLRAGAGNGIEQDAALVLAFNLRKEQIQGEQTQHEQRKEPAGQRGLPAAAAKRIAPAKEQRSRSDAGEQSGQAENRIEVASGQAQHGTPWTAQKDQCAHGRDDSEHEPGNGGGTAARLEIAKGQRRAKGTDHQADDLGAQVLDNSRAVQADGSGHVTLETGHADAHVGWVAVELKDNGQYADKRAGDNYAHCCGKKVAFHAFSSEKPKGWTSAQHAVKPGTTGPPGQGEEKEEFGSAARRRRNSPFPPSARTMKGPHPVAPDTAASKIQKSHVPTSLQNMISKSYQNLNLRQGKEAKKKLVT